MSSHPNSPASFKTGRAIFALAIAANGAETLVCAHVAGRVLGYGSHSVPVMPWLPPIPSMAYAFGILWIACAVCLFIARMERAGALALAALLTICTLAQIGPRAWAHPGDMGMRTLLLEPLAIAAMAALLPAAIPRWLGRLSRYMIAVSFVVFGVDHFIALKGIASLVPRWLPWHEMWVAFFGVVFIAAALSIALRILEPWGAAGVSLMFGIWLVTLHLPRLLGLYGPTGSTLPDEWASMLIALALCGGSLALAGRARD